MVCIQWRFFHKEYDINIMLWWYELDWIHSEWVLKVYRVLSSQGVDILVCRIVQILTNKVTVYQFENLYSTEQWLKFSLYIAENTVLSWHWPTRWCCLSLSFVTIITVHVKCTVWESAELWMLNLVACIGTMCSAKLNTPRKHNFTEMDIYIRNREHYKYCVY
jgi:hypothetical protein